RNRSRRVWYFGFGARFLGIVVRLRAGENTGHKGITQTPSPKRNCSAFPILAKLDVIALGIQAT
ncbi:hypothetical protein, partial [Allochromatium palmeri]|uniref:hypothetical protein n=1 Tax=Allochromatium palmeri TaxID=231048 RepID=UPI001CA3A210